MWLRSNLERLYWNFSFWRSDSLLWLCDYAHIWRVYVQVGPKLLSLNTVPGSVGDYWWFCWLEIWVLELLIYGMHPLSHLGVAHLVHLLDELVVFWPERHLEKLYNPENRRKGLKHFRFHYRFRIRLQRLVGWSFWTVKKHAPRWNLKILIAPRCILFNRTVQPKNSH